MVRGRLNGDRRKVKYSPGLGETEERLCFIRQVEGRRRHLQRNETGTTLKGDSVNSKTIESLQGKTIHKAYLWIPRAQR